MIGQQGALLYYYYYCYYHYSYAALLVSCVYLADLPDSDGSYLENSYLKIIDTFNLLTFVKSRSKVWIKYFITQHLAKN